MKLCSITTNNTGFGKFSLRNLESSRNRRLTGNIVKDTFIKYPRTIALGTTLAALLATGGFMISSLVEKSKAQKTAQIEEMYNLFDNSSQDDFANELYLKAKNALSDWNITTKTVYENEEPTKMVVMKFSPKYDILNDTYDYTEQATPPCVKAAFGLNDRVLNKYNNLKSVLRDENRSCYSNFDRDSFKVGAQVIFPFSEIGKNTQRAKEFYLEQIK